MRTASFKVGWMPFVLLWVWRYLYAHECLYFADENAVLSDLFRVLHVDSCGDYLEQVSEVTSSHVKLKNLDFSTKGVTFLRKLGLPVKISADVLIYMRVRTGLTLHVYLVPRDRSLQQVI